jgi:RNA polymerase sigma factor (TIGR02999 family)
MNDVTRILSAVEHGDLTAAEQLLPLVYDELRRLAAQRLAREKSGQTLQPTGLVHEAYLRLVGPQDPGWNGRGHFFAAAAEAMRRILVERARHKRRRKHGGGLLHQDSNLDDLFGPDTRDPLEVFSVNKALNQLAEKAPRKAELVKLRSFLGCTMAEATQVLGIAQATAEEDWTYSKAWLRRKWLRGEKKKRRPGDQSHRGFRLHWRMGISSDHPSDGGPRVRERNLQGGRQAAPRSPGCVP